MEINIWRNFFIVKQDVPSIKFYIHDGMITFEKLLLKG